MSSEVNDVINNICEKLGTTADIIVPEFARYMAAKNIKTLILGLIFLILDAVIVKSFLKWRKRCITEYKEKHNGDEDWVDDQRFPAVIGFCIIIGALSISSFIFILSGLDFINWMVSPKGAFVEYILSFKSR